MFNEENQRRFIFKKMNDRIQVRDFEKIDMSLIGVEVNEKLPVL